LETSHTHHVTDWNSHSMNLTVAIYLLVQHIFL
jgi:hypothetical protein